MKSWTRTQKYLLTIQKASLCVCFLNCFSFNMNEEEARSHFPQIIQPKFHTSKMGPHKIRYVSVDIQENQRRRPLIIFVHGSPGGWSAYLDYLKEPKLQAAAKLISVDRIGYGGSGMGHVLPSMKLQAKLLHHIIPAAHTRGPVILVGHSLGGTVVARISMDYPDDVQGLLLIASTASPDLEEPAWYNTIGDFFFIRWLLPSVLLTSNDEILPLREELEKMRPLWEKLQIPVTIIHGKKDSLVPPGNVDFLKTALSQAMLRILVPPQEGHFILWENTDLITREILALIKRTDQ